jgi:hypothetical protein
MAVREMYRLYPLWRGSREEHKKEKRNIKINFESTQWGETLVIRHKGPGS